MGKSGKSGHRYDRSYDGWMGMEKVLLKDNIT
jgi:hypothetical protein